MAPGKPLTDEERCHLAWMYGWLEMIAQNVRGLDRKLADDMMGEEALGTLECPCCGDVAATGCVHDGQPLECGCTGWMSVDSESPPEVCIDEEGCKVHP